MFGRVRSRDKTELFCTLSDRKSRFAILSPLALSSCQEKLNLHNFISPADLEDLGAGPAKKFATQHLVGLGSKASCKWVSELG